MTTQLEMNLQDDTALSSEPDAGHTPAIRFKGFSDAWINSELGRLLDITSAARVHKEEWADTGVPFFRTSDVVSIYKGQENKKAYISYELYKTLVVRTGAVKKNDLLVTGGGSIGIPYLVKTNAPLYFKDADLLWLKNTTGTDGYFLFTFFSSPFFIKYKNSITHIGTISHYTIEQAKSTPIYLSKYNEEQTAIGNYFQQLDSLIAQHQQKHTKLLNLKQALLHKMFPKQGTSVPEVRFKGFSRNWEVKEFGEIVSRKNIVCKELDLPRVEYEDITSGKGTLNKDICQKENTKTGIKFDQGDVLYGKLRPYLKNWLFADFEGIAVGDFWVLCANEQDRKFIYSLIQTPEFEKTANLSSGSKMPRSDWGLVSKKEFYTPIKKEEQAKIGQLFQQLDHLINQQNALLTKLGNLKHAYLAKMFV